jgi:hypothetical protein
VAVRFHELCEEMLPTAFLPTRARRFYTYFLKNLAFGHRLAAQIQHMESYEEIRSHVLGYFDEHPEHRRLRRSAAAPITDEPAPTDAAAPITDAPAPTDAAAGGTAPATADAAGRTEAPARTPAGTDHALD